MTPGYHEGLEAAAKVAENATPNVVGQIRELCDRVAIAIRALHDQPPAAGGDGWPDDAQFQRGDTVAKKGRASWRGAIVGWYRTDLTALGYAVESAFEPGSVQIYPETALEAWSAMLAVIKPDTKGKG